MTSVPSLVTIKNNVPLADSRQIAHELGIEHRSFFAMILEYQKEIEEDFNQLRFQNTVGYRKQGGGNPQRYALLTEDQTYAYLAYSQNTPQARACKRKLVKAFSEMRTLSAQPAPTQSIPLRPDLAELFDLEGMPERWIRMSNIMAMRIDLWNSGVDLPHVRRFLMEQFEAEANALTPEEDAWDNPPQITTKRRQRRLKR